MLAEFDQWVIRFFIYDLYVITRSNRHTDWFLWYFIYRYVRMKSVDMNVWITTLKF